MEILQKHLTGVLVRWCSGVLPRRHGFTLLEIMVSMVILLLLASGALSAVSYAKRASLRIQDKAAAVSFLELKMNEYKQKGAKSIASEPSASVCAPDPLCDNDCCLDAPGSFPNGKFNTKVVSDPSDPGFKEVKVNVWWDERMKVIPTGGGPETPARRQASIVAVLFQE
jgi:prepilin-type N-terminal cleavage/methylation domain-containing protein